MKRRPRCFIMKPLVLETTFRATFSIVVNFGLGFALCSTLSTMSRGEAAFSLQVYTPQAIPKGNIRVDIIVSHTHILRMFTAATWGLLCVCDIAATYLCSVCACPARESDIWLAEPTDEGRLEFRLFTDRSRSQGCTDYGRKIAKWNLLNEQETTFLKPHYRTT